MTRSKQEKIILYILVIATVVMTILRFLLNEKGRVNPDSIRFMRGAHVFPIIDNTTTPLGYPLSLKFFTLFGLDEFWSSKIVGISAYLFIVVFAYIKKFYFRETVITGALFSFVSIFSYTMSEAATLPFLFLFLYCARQIIIQELRGLKAFILLSSLLILLFNFRYPALFIMGAVFLFGILQFKRKHSKIFILASFSAFVFVFFYKITFIDYFNKNYVDNALDIGFYPTSQLIVELFQGLATTYNPFIHIANPAGGNINVIIYGIGILNVLIMLVVFIKNGLSETEFFLVLTGTVGIACSFFIQFLYVTNALDYRLLAPFSFPIWLVYFRKIWQIFGRVIFLIPAMSLIMGVAFIYLSRGNYLENRSKVQNFLKDQNLLKGKIHFYIHNEKELKETQLAELVSTVNSHLEITRKPQDTLKNNVLTIHKLLSKIKIDENSFQ